MIQLYFASLGCDKNLVDTEHMLGSLDPAVYTVTNDEEAADVIVINTCCFIDDAKEESDAGYDKVYQTQDPLRQFRDKEYQRAESE